MARVKLVDLYECVESALIALGLSKSTLMKYRYTGFRPLQCFFEQKKCVFYSRKLAEKFVSETLSDYESGLVSIFKYRRIRKVVAMLDEYKDTGTIKWAQLPNRNAAHLVCKHFETILTHYVSDLISKDRCSPSKIPNIKCIVRHFLRYLEEQGCRNLHCLNRNIVSAFVPVIAKRQPGDMSSVISVMKSFLGYLYDNKYIACELVSVFPRYPAKRKKHFEGFTREEAKTLISSVPSDTNVGKRNIAIFTVGEGTGLRASDVANLKLRDIDWRHKTISVVQNKTKRPLILPMENHVGDALAEYILYGRPNSDSPFVFLTARRPFRPLSAQMVSQTTSRGSKKAGIENNLSFGKGFHCFRRGVGTWLLEAELPLTMISEILGHTHVDSTKPYLSTDLDGLRECAIGLEGIEIRKGVFQ